MAKVNTKNIQKTLQKQRDFFRTGITKDLNWRRSQLEILKTMMETHQDELIEAMQKDLAKPAFEAYMSEISTPIKSIDNALHHLDTWAKPHSVKSPILHFKSKSYTVAEPYGLALIIAPWNYPVELLISPLAGAISAGNCAVLKPSEITSHTSAVLTKLIKQYFKEEFISVFEGGKEVNQALLAEKSDIIFFTGSTFVGRIVMEAAAKHLTPVILELGGKSPCIVDEHIDLDKTARRIVWGKFFNCGQTCIAPDYVLVHKNVKKALLNRMKEIVEEFFGKNPELSPDLGRIVSDRHFDRLVGMLDGKIVTGGDFDKKKRYIAPTIIDGVKWTDKVMQEEIFGPIMPVLEYTDLDKALREINDRPKPLALYIFSKDQIFQEKVVSGTSSGGVCINDTIIHVTPEDLPFGGVGESGMGQYHGKASFEAFSHSKSVLKRSLKFDPTFRYPPYKNILNWLKKFV